MGETPEPIIEEQIIEEPVIEEPIIEEPIIDPREDTIERLDFMFGELFKPNTPVTWRVNSANRACVVRHGITIKMGPKNRETGREDSVLIKYEREGETLETWVSTKNVSEREILPE